MSVLDTFYILFKSDADDLRDGVHDANRELDRVEETSKRAGEGIKDLVLDIGKWAAAYLAVDASLEHIGEVAALKQTADALNVGVDSLDAFGRAAEAMGGDAQGARDSLTDMAESIGEAIQDAKSGKAQAFQSIGMSLKDMNGNAKDAIEGILSLSDAVQGMSRQEAIFRIKEIGITDNRTVEMVLKGRKALEDMIKTQKENGVVTEEQAENAVKFKIATSQLISELKDISMVIANVLIPPLISLMDGFKAATKFVGEHKVGVTAAFGVIAAIVASIYVPSMLSAAAATLAATWPIIAIGAAIAAASVLFGLIVDDIYNFIQGNDSMVGELSKKYPIIGEAVRTLVSELRLFKDVAAAVIGFFVDLFTTGPAQAIDNFKAKIGEAWAAFEAANPVIKDVEAAFNDVIGGIESMWDSLIGKIQAGVDAIKGAIDTVTGLFSETADEAANKQNVMANASPWAQQQLNTAASFPLAVMASPAAGNTNKTTSIKTGDIVIHTQATDADGISKAVAQSMQDQLRQAAANADDGVSH